MEWLIGLALLPALMCAVMMGGTALVGVIGWRSIKGTPAGGHTPVDGDTTAAKIPENARP